MGELEGRRGGREVAGEAALEAARAGWFGLVALRKDGGEQGLRGWMKGGRRVL